jgi:hypothetical protein
MVALAIGLTWAAYYGGLYGYCLVRGYGVTPKEMLSPKWPQYTLGGNEGGSGFGPGGSAGNGVGGGGGGSF